MSQKPLIAVTLAVTTTCLFAFGLYTVKSVAWKRNHEEPTFPGAGMFYSSPAQVTEKYRLSIYPAPWLISIIWLTVVLSNIAAQAYLLAKSKSNVTFNMPSKVYHYWAFVWALTTIWTFLFDAENHIGCAVVVFLVVMFSWRSLLTAGTCYNQYKERLAKETKTENAMDHPFRFLVVESLGVISMWSLVAFGISVGYVCAYKNSRDQSEASLSGLMSPEEAATMGLIIIFCCFIAWWTLDVAYWGEDSDCIQSIYPSFSFTMLGLGISNYHVATGVSFNNALCLIASVLSLVAMVERFQLKRAFARQHHRTLMSNGFHKK